MKGQPSQDAVRVTAAQQLDLNARVFGMGDVPVGGVKVKLAASPTQDAACRPPEVETGRDGIATFKCEFARAAVDREKVVTFTAELVITDITDQNRGKKDSVKVTVQVRLLLLLLFWLYNSVAAGDVAAYLCTLSCGFCCYLCSAISLLLCNGCHEMLPCCDLVR